MWLKGGLKVILTPYLCLSRIKVHVGINHLTFRGGGGGRKTSQKSSGSGSHFRRKILALRAGRKNSWYASGNTFAVRNLLFALRKLLSYSENYIIYFGNDFMHYLHCLLYYKITCIYAKSYYTCECQITPPPCLNENMSFGIFKK